jgi:hypothetical protein
VGHHAGTLRKVARLLGLEFVEVGGAPSTQSGE